MLALTVLVLPLSGCAKEDVFAVAVNGGNGEKTYSVSYDFYRTVFLYLKGIVSDTVSDSEGNMSLASVEEQNKAIKEVAEDTFVEFYALLTFAADHGVSITEDDKKAYQAEYREKLQEYVNALDDEDFDYNGTKEEYAEKLYRNALRIGGMTPEYHEFMYYQDILTKRLKMKLGGDISEYLNQSYCHYKQVILFYDKGDAVAESAALQKIEEAREKLLSGVDIDTVIKEYGDDSYRSELYFDAYGNVVGSSTGDMLNTVIVNTVKALEENGTSEIMSGEEDDRLAYFAVYQRQGFDIEFICGNSGIAEDIYNHSYVGASSYSPHYSRYLLLLESYKQNTALTPHDVKAYNRLNIMNID